VQSGEPVEPPRGAPSGLAALDALAKEAMVTVIASPSVVVNTA